LMLILRRLIISPPLIFRCFITLIFLRWLILSPFSLLFISLILLYYAIIIIFIADAITITFIFIASRHADTLSIFHFDAAFT
jgi:hypothetical protein